MRFIQLAAAVALLLLAGATTAHAGQPVTTSVVLPMDQAETNRHANTILTKVNELRASKGLGPVTRYRELDVVATDWSQQMASRASLSHRPNFADHYPAGWHNAAENVAMHGGSGDIGAMMFDLWLNSPGHYANMVNPELNSIGIGLAHDSANGAWYATQNFAGYATEKASGLTRTADSQPRSEPRPTPTPTPEPASPSPKPSPSPSPETASPSPEPTPTPSPTPEAEPTPTPSASSSMSLPRELTEDPAPSTFAPMTTTPAPRSVAPSPSPVEVTTPPPPTPVAAELEGSGPPWGLIAIGGVLAGSSTAGLVLLIRRLF